MRLLPTLLLALPALAFAQGQLTPPDGAIGPRGPRPTMKTLDQIEPRIPLRDGSHGVTQNANGGFTISASGSFYLEGNLSVGTGDGIVIEVNNVSLDLSGYTIASFAAPASGTGIKVNGRCSNIAIRNGHITGTTTCNESTNAFTGGGFYDGIYSGTIQSQGISATGISVVGISGMGIFLSDEGSVISGCTASICAGGGLRADTVNASTATICKFYVIVADTVADCQADGVSVDGNYPTISAKSVSNCVGRSISGCGIRATTVTNSYGSSTSDCGIYSSGTATGSTGTSTTAAGLRAIIATGCKGYSSSGIGLEAVESATACAGTTTTGPYGLAAFDTFTANRGTADNCRGEITGAAATSSIGLIAGTATNCIGINKSGTGLSADLASNCSAYTATGSIAMSVAGTANSCRGKNAKAGGIAIQAAIAVACTSAGGTIEATNKYNMP